MSNVTRGVTTNEDLDPSLISRDTRSWRHKLQGFAADTGAGFVMICLGALITILPITGVTFLVDPVLFIALFFYLYARGKIRTLQYRTPMVKNKDGSVSNDGLMLVGNDLVDNSEVWFSNDDFRTHMLVFGSTGSGKTRFLLGLLYQALLVGSGCMYVDGKGDNTVWWLVFSFCRRVGREDDLLVINYLTGGKSSSGKSDGLLTRKSNTNNPFAQGSGEQLRSLVVGLMRESAGDGDMWKGMASAMMGGLLKCLTYLRDSGELQLDVAVLRDYLPLDQIVRLSLRPELPDSALAPIKKYLLELPGYVEEEAILGRINPKVYEQHGYRIMQFSEVLSDLEDTYGHIFSAPMGEVDFKDVVFNRRILFVMLPALEKDPDSLSGLGKMVVAGVRSALAPALGDTLEGLKTEVVDKKPTNSSVPFLMILDEYGYYSVKGFAVVAAQARSLGVSVVFAGQDYPSFKKGSEEEAQATIANTNIKIGMKVEEDETAKILIDRADEADVSVTEGSERATGGLSDYKDRDNTRIEKRKRIAMRDMVQQKPGQAHIIFGDELSRCQLFYAEPHEVSEAYLNKFLMIDYAQKAKIESINGTFDKLNKIFESEVDESKDTKPQSTDDGLKTLFADYKTAISRKESLMDAAVIATGMVEWRAQNKDVELREKAEMATMPTQTLTKATSENVAKQTGTVVKQTGPEFRVSPSVVEVINKQQQVTKPSAETEPKEDKTVNWAELEDFDKMVKDEEKEILQTVEEENRPNDTVKNEASVHSQEFEELLNTAVMEEINKTAGKMSPAEKNKAKPKNALLELEMLAGSSKEDAQNSSQKAIEILGERAKYPNKPTPKRKETKEMDERLQALLNQIN